MTDEEFNTACTIACEKVQRAWYAEMKPLLMLAGMDGNIPRAHQRRNACLSVTDKIASAIVVSAACSVTDTYVKAEIVLPMMLHVIFKDAFESLANMKSGAASFDVAETYDRRTGKVVDFDFRSMTGGNA